MFWSLTKFFSVDFFLQSGKVQNQENSQISCWSQTVNEILMEKRNIHFTKRAFVFNPLNQCPMVLFKSGGENPLECLNKDYQNGRLEKPLGPHSWESQNVDGRTRMNITLWRTRMGLGEPVEISLLENLIGG